MITFWQNHINGYVGGHHYLNDNVKNVVQHISKTTGGPAVTIIAQASGMMRFVNSRIFGRVN